jgi:tRNA modification GTPase
LYPSTIVASASGPGPSGVCVVRVSGPLALKALEKIAGGVPEPRVATLRILRDVNGDIIDKALVLWFRGPASFTGEDVVEFQGHGGRAVVSGIIEACLAIDGITLARPGDFTRRSFENGKMDLSAAEGLGDLIEAETTAQRKQALRQMEGALATEVTKWREEIIAALADAEGDIDFPDEDLPPGLTQRARAGIAALRSKLQLHVDQSNTALRIRDGFRVAIIGAPNAGKSSLLNALAKREAAIVSSMAGTTRDVIEVRLVLSGLVILLSDTAGIRETADEIEVQGVSRARAVANAADLRVGLIAGPQERAQLAPLMGKDDIWLLTKSDAVDWSDQSNTGLAISSQTGTGLEALEAMLIAHAGSDLSSHEAAPLTRLRHKEAVLATIRALDRALAGEGQNIELIAEDLRLAARALGEITGRVDMEDVLDRLFSQFCIGK